ncbi:MAG: OmpA family protein [Thermodesulfobacteriota bacterium]|nr:OmpA family protein [Thermodesulfobacteriota bacterium]
MKKLRNLLFLFALVALVASCAPTIHPPLKAFDSGSSTTAEGQYVEKVDNFQVILDASLTMQNGFLDAREIVSRINQGIPSDLNYNGGLRSIGHSSSQSKNATDLLYGMNGYNQADFHDGLGEIKYIGGPTPMATALLAAGNDLKTTAGKSALILVSDGLHMGDAPAAAKSIKTELADNLCIYTISIGNKNNGAGQDMLKKLADIGQCGFATTDASLADNADMANFINQVFLTKAAPKTVPLLDSDGDGVTDDKDWCPNTPKGAPVDKNGCPTDSDGDGVFDYLDNCPNTPKGVSVDATGCPTKLTLNINFAHDSSVVEDRYLDEIAKAAQCINQYPGNQVNIYGHTDSTGTDAYNQKLSERRAAAIVKVLVEKFSIPDSRLVAHGFGEAQPIADNNTKAGRLENRRVEIACGATE